MRSRMSGLGFVGMLIVVVIVLWLAARNWQSAAPALLGGDRGAEHGVDSRALPGLDHMQEKTNEHADRLEEALDDTNR